LKLLRTTLPSGQLVFLVAWISIPDRETCLLLPFCDTCYFSKVSSLLPSFCDSTTVKFVTNYVDPAYDPSTGEWTGPEPPEEFQAVSYADFVLVRRSVLTSEHIVSFLVIVNNTALHPAWSQIRAHQPNCATYSRVWPPLGRIGTLLRVCAIDRSFRALWRRPRSNQGLAEVRAQF